MIVFCAADLIWATRIKSTADSLGISCRPVRNLEMLEARLTDSPGAGGGIGEVGGVRSLIVDLEAGPVALDLIRRLHGDQADDRCKSIRIIAFGPHVATDLFAQARSAGADALLARGAFNSRLPDILRELNADPASIHDDLHE